jgi:membrane protein DedA with SNARE-associated domain
MVLGDFSSFQGVFEWVISHGYPLMFLAMCIEGPTVTAAATFAATLGYFNPMFIFILSILGDVIPDAIYYAIGYFGRIKLVKRFGHKFGLTDARIEKMEKGIRTHGGRTVAVLKYTPVLSTPGLMLVGAMKMNWWKYLGFVFIVTLQKTLTFMLLGYFFGKAYNISSYIKYGALIPFVIIIAYFTFVFIYKKMSEKFIKKIDRI